MSGRADAPFTTSTVGDAAVGLSGRRLRRWVWLLPVGPGLMVMLADTDAGSIITDGQSGARWGYRLLLVELLLIPVLYLVMELTVRIGITTGKGHAQLIREQFGRRWATLSVAMLLVSVCGALVTEFAGIAGVGRLFGIPATATVPAAALVLVAIVVSGSYRRVELIGITLGLFELRRVLSLVCPTKHTKRTSLSPQTLKASGFRMV